MTSASPYQGYISYEDATAGSALWEHTLPVGNSLPLNLFISESETMIVEIEFPQNKKKSTAISLLKFATGWAGNDMKEIMEMVYQTRGLAEF